MALAHFNRDPLGYSTQWCEPYIWRKEACTRLLILYPVVYRISRRVQALIFYHFIQAKNAVMFILVMCGIAKKIYPLVFC